MKLETIKSMMVDLEQLEEYSVEEESLEFTPRSVGVPLIEEDKKDFEKAPVNILPGFPSCSVEHCFSIVILFVPFY